MQKKSIESLTDLYKRIKSTRLSKPIDKFNSPEEIIDSIIRDNADAAVNQMVTAIPSKTRNSLKSSNCYSCDDGTVECEDCDGYGYMLCRCDEDDDDCDECYGDGEITCPECDGDDEVECEKCDGDGCNDCNGSGYTYCKNCKNGRVDCPECSSPKNKPLTNDGTCPRCKKYLSGTAEQKEKFKCKTCKGKREIPCEDCKNGSAKWESFLNFLKLHADKKELIIDFFSKKGGRYSGDDYDDDYDSPIDRIKNDIEKLINLPSVDKIRENIKKEKNIKFIYEDEKILIIASNYDGLQKYGSSYWCITEDEDTYSDYVLDDDNQQQWVVYFKDKKPLVDEKSVMGVTINIISGRVSASHWEDDAQADATIVSDIFKNISFDNILLADQIFRENSPLIKFLDIKKSKDKYKRLVREQFDDGDTVDIYDFIDVIFEDEDEQITDVIKDIYNTDLGKSVSKVIRSILKDLKLKLRSDYNIPSELFSFDLKEYFEYNQSWNGQSLDNFIHGKYDDDLKIKYITWFMTNGYNISKYLRGNPPAIFRKINLEKVILSSINSISSWEGINSILSKESIDTIYDKVFKSHKSYIVSNSVVNQSFIKFAIKWIKQNKLIKKYKNDIIECVNTKVGKTSFNKDMLNYIIDNIDDDDVEIACTYKLLHPRVAHKFNFEMKRKVLEHIKYWNQF